MLKLRKRHLPSFLTAIAAAMVAMQYSVHAVMAQIVNPVTGELGQGIGSADGYEGKAGELFSTYFVMIWQALIMFGGLTVLIYYLWGALEWITAGGDSGKAEKARNKFTNATIGLVLLISVFVIVGFISVALFRDEFQILNFTLPTAEA